MLEEFPAFTHSRLFPDFCKKFIQFIIQGSFRLDFFTHRVGRLEGLDRNDHFIDQFSLFVQKILADFQDMQKDLVFFIDIPIKCRPGLIDLFPQARYGLEISQDNDKKNGKNKQH
jgi:hypothetical protein